MLMVSAAPTLRALIEALDEPAMLLESGRVRLANRAAQTLLGAAIEGSDVRLVLRHPRALEQLLPGTPGDTEITGIGQFDRPWTLSVRELQPGALLVRLIDRSATIAAERMRVDFVANASHELRTPLSTILGFSETLADGAELGETERTRFGEIIRAEARRMLRIIEDLMSLSRIEAGRFVAPTDEVAIGPLLETARANALTIAGARECTINVAFDDDLPPVIGDHGQLLQLLDNLLTNAVRYGCRNGRCTVTISAIADGGGVRLGVRDEGAGIARQHLPRITERFYRVDAARSRDSGGTGLGLAIVKHIVERHRGTLSIVSEEGEGTEVSVRLPAGPGLVS